MLGAQDNDVISPQTSKDDFLLDLPTQEPTPHKAPTATPTPEHNPERVLEQTSEPSTPDPTPDETLDETLDETTEPAPAGPFGPLTQKTTRPEAVPKEQTREIHDNIENINIAEGRRIVYVNDLMAICRRENVPKLRPFKEELIKKYKTTKPTRASSKLLEFLRDLSSFYKDHSQSNDHLPISDRNPSNRILLQEY